MTVYFIRGATPMSIPPNWTRVLFQMLMVFIAVGKEVEKNWINLVQWKAMLNT